jgi:tetratricopeptide (TPR) repeat protein
MLGRHEEALPLYEKSLDVLEKAYGSKHAVVARLLYESANTHLALDQTEQAHDRFNSSLAIREQILGGNHPDLARSLDSVAAMLIERAEYAQAAEMLQRSIAIHESGGSEPVELGQSLGQLGRAYAGQQRYPEAEDALGRSLEIVERELDANHPIVASTRTAYEQVSEKRPSADPVAPTAPEAPAEPTPAAVE